MQSIRPLPSLGHSPDRVRQVGNEPKALGHILHVVRQHPHSSHRFFDPFSAQPFSKHGLAHRIDIELVCGENFFCVSLQAIRHGTQRAILHRAGDQRHRTLHIAA